MRARRLPACLVVSMAAALSACAGSAARQDVSPLDSPIDSSRDSSRDSSIPHAHAPLVIAHRGGTGDAPENTLAAIRLALANHADAIWLTVQLSRDGVPVLYRPADLAALTDARGPVAAKTAAELARVNAGWQFAAADGNDHYPWRRTPAPIPTLAEALAAIPPNVPVILDMKALPAAPQARAVAQVLDAANAWPRVRIYSTEADYQRAFAAWPQARVFEARDATRTRLVTLALAQRCEAPPPAGAWTAFEWRRALDVAEHYTLGEAHSNVPDAMLWSAPAVQCFRTQPNVRIVAIGVNDEADYRAAACAGVDAVLADSPRRMASARDGFREDSCR